MSPTLQVLTAQRANSAAKQGYSANKTIHEVCSDVIDATVVQHVVVHVGGIFYVKKNSEIMRKSDDSYAMYIRRPCISTDV